MLHHVCSKHYAWVAAVDDRTRQDSSAFYGIKKLTDRCYSWISALSQIGATAGSVPNRCDQRDEGEEDEGVGAGRCKEEPEPPRRRESSPV